MSAHIRSSMWILLVALFCDVGSQTLLAQGLVLPGVGPINRSMAGASVAAPIDAAGAMHWNPAAIAGLREREIMFGAELLYPRTTLSSQITGVGGGADGSDSGVTPLPTSAIVHREEDSCWTFGLGVYTIGGFGANYPGNAANPILSPPPPAGFGVGPAFSRIALVQIVPTAAVWLTDRLAIGMAPTFTAADLSIDPGFFAAPDNANGVGGPTYPSATHTRYHWGIGFQIGLYWEGDGPWSFGASFKSPQWFETFDFNSQDEIGAPRTLSLDADYPMIISIGGAYRGERWLFATDIRYIDYDNVQTFGERAAFNPDASVSGLGWTSVFSVATGAQYTLNERTTVRIGYLYNQNPVPAETAFFNIVSSPIYQHAIFLGASRRISDSLMFSLSYLKAFENSITGPYQTPGGPVPGTVTIEQESDAITLGVHVLY